MALDIQVTFDVHDLDVMSRFWALALDYEEEPPPEGFSSWEDFAERNAIPPELWRAAVVDPERKRPRPFFQPVPDSSRTEVADLADETRLIASLTRPRRPATRPRTRGVRHQDGAKAGPESARPFAFAS